MPIILGILIGLFILLHSDKAQYQRCDDLCVQEAVKPLTNHIINTSSKVKGGE